MQSNKTIFKQKLFSILFGVFLSVIFIEIVLRLGGFIFLSLQDSRNKNAIKQKGSYRILCLGESTTAFGDKDAYPYQLGEILNQKNTGIKFSVINKGVPSINTSYILAELEQNLDRYKPDIVTAMIGVNDTQNYVFYEDNTSPKIIIFLKDFRVYKLGKLILYNLINKLQEKDARIMEIKQKDSKEIAKKTGLNTAGFFPEKSQEMNSRYSKALLLLGKIYLKQKNFSKAEITYEKVIKNNPANDIGYIELGKTIKRKEKYLKAEELFKKFAERGAENDLEYLELARSYRKEGVFIIASEFLRKAIESNSKNIDVYIELLLCYLDLNKNAFAEELFDRILELNLALSLPVTESGVFNINPERLFKAEEMFKKAIELSPGNAAAYIELGGIYNDTGRLMQAEEMFKKIIEFKPNDLSAYIGLTKCYIKQGNHFQAKDAFKKCLELIIEENKKDCFWGDSYLNQGKYNQAEKFLEKTLNLDPNNIEAYIALGRAYIEQGKLLEAEKLLKKGIALFPENVSLYKSLVGLYAVTDTNSYMQKYAKKLNSLMLQYDTPMTSGNYKKIKKILDKKGVKLVCVQYPMRSVEPLKRIFEGEKNVILIDNEGIFKEAVKKEGYKEYFTDNFAGDFGHCTAKGNSLLAENIAKVILKEALNK